MKCIIEENAKIRIGESERLEPTEGECVFGVRSCGICGSDIPRVFSGGAYYYPIVLGHEFSGVVKKSKNPALVGKRACVFPILPCGKCDFCKKEQWASCVKYDYYGSRRDGGMQSELLIKESNLVFLPDEVSFDGGAMAEPTAVCLHAVKKAEITEDCSVLIYGAGTIGLLSGMWARALGAGEVYFSDPDQQRAKMAIDLGFKIYNGEAVDRVIEASGAPSVLNDAIMKCRAMGIIVLVGHSKCDVSIEHTAFVQILRKQLKLVGSWNSDFSSSVNDWTESLLAIAEGKINPEALITHRIPLEKADSAFAIIGGREEFYNKIMVVENDD